MTENPHQPKEYDAVLGGQNSPPINAAILGGIEGVKRRLAYPEIEVRVAALSDTIKYGEAGLNLLVQALQDESKQVKFTAYSLLKNRIESKSIQQLAKFLLSWDFDVINVNKFGQEISRRHQEAQYFPETLGNGVFLEMVLIPGGTFRMGSPKNEPKRDNNESPQHQVRVSTFFIGKYPVTQTQWKAVAALPQVNIFLNPNPSFCEDENKPVACISWHEAVEFCARLSQKTGRHYRLPSEAEWEYACRARTKTPFHFGETITSELANYYAAYTYAFEVQGTYCQQTTPVGSFHPNGFGLYDMHGNVWEWCANFWHENYGGFTSDRNVWQNKSDNYYMVLRGGSWSNYPDSCRSASRNKLVAGFGNDFVGFRVACTYE